MAAMIGVDRLVPPICAQPLSPFAVPVAINALHNSATVQLLYVSYAPSPLSGSATAETSATVRCAQRRSCCQAGLRSYREQPLPAPGQACSVQPRRFVAGSRVVPPTAVTNRDDAGHCTP